MSCIGCDEIINVGNAGTDGWSPVLALSEDCSGKIVHRLISWIDGTGTKPDYNSNIMTDAWLLANPIYLSANGFTDDCDEAVNLKPSNGTNGTNGTNGEQGPPGEDGCTPEISFTANVGEERPIECTVQGVIDGCTSSWNINFPEEIFTSDTVVEAVTGSEAFTTAVEDAIDGVLNVTPNSDTSLSISNTGTSADIVYTVESYLPSSGIPVINLATSPSSWIDSYIVGNQMTVDFRISIQVISGVGDMSLHFKIPQGKTVKSGYTYTNTVGYAPDNYTTWTMQGYPIVSTNSLIAGYIRLNAVTSSSNGGIAIVPGIIHIFTGQLTFLIN
jgi:hypothetical protein